MKKKAAFYLLRLGIQKGLGLLCYCLGTGFVLYRRAAVYFVVHFIGTLVCSAILLRKRPGTLAERGKVQTDSPKWDKLLLALFWLFNYFLIYLAAGLSAQGPEPLGALFFAGLALCLCSGAVSLWAMLENTFLESTARIQTDRNQTVCQTGPYRIVRHPTYAAVLLQEIGVSLVFPCRAVILTAAFLCAVIVLRTAKEDRMLAGALPGYPEYMKRVRYRIVPFIW